MLIFDPKLHNLIKKKKTYISSGNARACTDLLPARPVDPPTDDTVTKQCKFDEMIKVFSVDDHESWCDISLLFRIRV